MKKFIVTKEIAESMRVEQAARLLLDNSYQKNRYGSLKALITKREEDLIVEACYDRKELDLLNKIIRIFDYSILLRLDIEITHLRLLFIITKINEYSLRIVLRGEADPRDKELQLYLHAFIKTANFLREKIYIARYLESRARINLYIRDEDEILLQNVEEMLEYAKGYHLNSAIIFALKSEISEGVLGENDFEPEVFRYLTDPTSAFDLCDKKEEELDSYIRMLLHL